MKLSVGPGGAVRPLAFVALLVIPVTSCGGGASPSPAPTTPSPAATVTPPSPSANLPTLKPTPTTAATTSPIGTPTADGNPSVGSIVPQAIFPADLTVGTFSFVDDVVWAFDASGVTRIDPDTNESTHLDLLTEQGDKVFSVSGAVGFGSIWVADFENGQLLRFDEEDGSLQSTTEIADPTTVIATADSLWVTAHHDGSVIRIDPNTEEILATVEVGTAGNSGPSALIEAKDQIWTGVPRDFTVAGIDPLTNTNVGAIEVAPPGNPCGGIGSFGDRLFVSGCADSQSLAVVDMATMESVSSPEFEGGVTAPVTAGDQLWLGVIGAEGSLTSLDPVSLEAGQSLPVTGGYPFLLLVADDSMWVSIEKEPDAWILRLPIAEFD